MSQPKTVQVELAGRGYDILVGSGLLKRAADYIVPKLASKKAIIVTDAHVGTIYGSQLKANLRTADITCEILTIPAGEGSKNFATFEWLMNQLLALKVDRKTTIIALGGGVVGDLAGFAASVLLRGVPFIQIPTSLLAQVDSSVGGKTAINASVGKNLIGSFYQPQLVLADSDVLKTLPPRELKAGYAEVIKYGLIMSPEFYEDCLSDGAKIIAGDEEAQQYAVLASCQFKAEIVKMDEREKDDLRALLNFGHTFGHALEAETGFSETLLHGEAVAIGMVMACRLSHRMGLIGADVETQLAAHFKALGMMAHPNDVKGQRWAVDAIASHFADDKKAEGGKLTFVVLNEIGRAVVAKNVDAALARDVVASYL